MKGHESKENYLEAILMLSQSQATVRSVDVANFLQFSAPSVSVAVGNLKRALLLNVDEGGALTLTDAGRAMAEEIYDRHRLLTDCLIALGVDEQTAQEDACRIEHVISAYSFAKIKEYAAAHGLTSAP